MGDPDVTRGLPADLASVLRDQSVIVPQDGAVFELIASWAKAPTLTASARPAEPVAPMGAVALEDVRRERVEQERRKTEGRFEFSCADDGLTNAERFAILGEEVGEVAREVLTQGRRRLARDSVGTREALRAELVQVAAVAVAWVEAIDQGY